MRSHVWMGAGLAAGLLLGLVAAATHAPVLLWLAAAVRPVGAIFLNLLSMVVIPLVATALFAGVAGLGDLRQVGRLGVRTLAFYWGTTLVAIALGFLVGALLVPRGALSPDQQAALRDLTAGDQGALRQAAEQIPGGARFLVELIPANPVRAAVDGALLPLVVFVTIFAAAAAALPVEKRAALTDLADVATQALIKVVHWVLWLAPLGIFALVLPTVAQFGWSLVKAMLWFILAVVLGCGVFIAVVYLPAVALLARVRPGRFLRAGLPSMLMGFSTTSSLATLPMMLDAARRDLHISPAVAGFALPLGASANRGGSALFQAVAVLFIAQLYGAPLGSGAMFQAGAAVFLASLTVAAVPAGSVVSLFPAFTATGLPLSGLTILISLDRIPDMFRTMTNVTGHLAGATVIAAVEGERVG
ncbi:MAG: dicarboxylate/amino acid:cation symporter [Gemmatimonadetes bacterium]|nr:dicarboxylate/amino acid:cation symporter [Gemmatimonadota bacterium]